MEANLRLTQGEWSYRLYPPLNPESTHQLVILLHGWTGDENSMSIFARNLSGQYWILSPRAPFTSPEGGYGWVLQEKNLFFDLEDFKPVVVRLLQYIDQWILSEHFATNHFSLIGFSQGALMAYATTLLHPNRIDAMASLAGFFPSNWQGTAAQTAFKDKPLFVAHGKKDEIIPIAYDYQGVQYLKGIGAKVTFCEDAVGHKISLQSSHTLTSFFKGLAAPDQGN